MYVETNKMTVVHCRGGADSHAKTIGKHLFLVM